MHAVYSSHGLDSWVLLQILSDILPQDISSFFSQYEPAIIFSSDFHSLWTKPSEFSNKRTRIRRPAFGKCSDKANRKDLIVGEIKPFFMRLLC